MGVIQLLPRLPRGGGSPWGGDSSGAQRGSCRGGTEDVTNNRCACSPVSGMARVDRNADSRLDCRRMVVCPVGDSRAPLADAFCLYDLKQTPARFRSLGDFPAMMWAKHLPVIRKAWPVVTVIVPGRNEGHILEKTLGSLCAMDYPHFRVVFVDDQSTDGTAEVCKTLLARHANLTVIHNTQPPRDGWIGKTWAVHQAAGYMNDGDYLLFTDSDLEFNPQCLRQMIRLAQHRRTDIASLLPAMRFETLGELLGLLAAMTIINSWLFALHVQQSKKIRACWSPEVFLLVKLATMITHLGVAMRAVRGQVVEDVAIGTRAKA